jgi:hypothetical protein
MRSGRLAVAVLVLLVGASARALPFVTTDESVFVAGLNGASVTLEGFEGVAAGFYPSPLDLGDVAVSTQGTGVFIWDVPSHVTEGAHGLSWQYLSLGLLSFEFETPINAFAIDVKRASEIPSTLSASLDDGPFYDVLVGITGDLDDVNFVGLIDFDGFSRISFKQAPEMAPDLGLDRVQFGNAIVPEPATAALLAAGLVGIAARARVSRRTRDSSATARR